MTLACCTLLDKKISHTFRFSGSPSCLQSAAVFIVYCYIDFPSSAHTACCHRLGADSAGTADIAHPCTQWNRRSYYFADKVSCIPLNYSRAFGPRTADTRLDNLRMTLDSQSVNHCIGLRNHQKAIVTVKMRLQPQSTPESNHHLNIASYNPLHHGLLVQSNSYCLNNGAGDSFLLQSYLVCSC